MAGAGISTAAGIPDFRSPETGLYSNLAHLNLPSPEAVFEINFFRSNPLPFYTLAHEIAPGKFNPTVTHSFIKLLHDKGLLGTHFTQNIDTLERRAGVPDSKIVEAHGSFASSRCIDCKRVYPNEEMTRKIAEKAIPNCSHCGGLAKPEIVFFGEALPERFHRSMYSLVDADLLFVMGTSLTVYPFAALCELVPSSCPRILVNFDEVGNIGERDNDLLLLGDCDDTVQKLCAALGWEKELDLIWQSAKKVSEEKGGEKETKDSSTSEKSADSGEVKKEEVAEKVVESLAAELQTNLVVEEKPNENETNKESTKSEEGSSQTHKGNLTVNEDPSKQGPTET